MPTKRAGTAGNGARRAVGTRRASPYEMLKSGILDGTFPPSAPLVEVQLAEWCGVSRTPIREALTRLEQDGLIERADRGYVVKARSPEEICDIYEARIALEALAARTAAERRGRVDQMRIERALALWEAGGENAEPAERARLNQDFHRAIWLASDSEPLIDLLSRLSLHLTRYPATTLMAPGRWETSVTEHRDLLAAIIDRDGDRAADVATKHFTAALDIRLELFEQEVF